MWLSAWLQIHCCHVLGMGVCWSGADPPAYPVVSYVVIVIGCHAYPVVSYVVIVIGCHYYIEHDIISIKLLLILFSDLIM